LISPGELTPYPRLNALLQKLEAGESVFPAGEPRQGNDTFWELFEDIYHQGMIWVTSYAAVPHIVRIFRQNNWFDWRLFLIVSSIEEARHNSENPPLPEELKEDYEKALHELFLYAAQNAEQLLKWGKPEALCFFISAAFSLGLTTQGLLIARFGDDEEAEQILKANL
jgi:hypothetical protein